ncbi:MAG: S41 family peptidase [Chitinophagaceae bacterium]|nr:S41 family peptidase [Chitinophagaceae bacterium]
MNQKKLQIWLPLLLAGAVVLGMFFGYKLKDNMGAYGPSFFGKQKRTGLEEILELVKAHYVDTVNTDSLSNTAIQNVISQLDPHSIYIPADHVQAVNDDMKGSFEGVGIEFGLIGDTVTVLQLFPKGPAEAAGIQIADKIISANDSMVSGKKVEYERIRKFFRGPKGTSVKVKLLRDGQPKEIIIQRGVIPVKSVDVAYMMEPGIGFIRLSKFASNTYEEFMQSLEDLKKQGMKKLILDLRDNGGGMLDDAIQIADEFLDDSKDIVYTEGKSTPKQIYTARRPGLFEEGKLVLLINEGSASASEVLTGALQDWDRAVIVGRRSFGKGLVQEQYQLSDGSALRLTISRYFTPIGRSIQKPYIRGEYGDYKEEINNRFNNGALFHNDSSNHKGKAYKTKGGRIVYGGGGISPDVFVPADSMEFQFLKKHELLGGLIEDASFTYYMSGKSKLNGFKTPQELKQHLTNDGGLWNIFQSKLAKNNLTVENFSPAQKQLISDYLNCMLGRFLWGNDGYFKMCNFSDKMVMKGLEEVKK